MFASSLTLLVWLFLAAQVLAAKIIYSAGTSRITNDIAIMRDFPPGSDPASIVSNMAQWSEGRYSAERRFIGQTIVWVVATNPSSDRKVALEMQEDMRKLIEQLWVLPILASTTLAWNIDATNSSSVNETATSIAGGLFRRYWNPSATTGQFDQPQPWFWWLSGSGWTAFLDYSFYTGDKSYDNAISQALAANIGEHLDFSPTSQQGWEANDDQAYWAYAGLTALEYGFPALPCVNSTGSRCANSWLDISENVFNTYANRWQRDSTTCSGGLKWQYNPQASGYYYKNSVSNGGFFQIAARLARYSNNQTYADWAVKVWDWSVAVGLVGSGFNVYDGTSDQGADNCSSLDHDQWSYNIATYLHGAANMYAFSAGNTTAQAQWESRVHGLVSAAKATFFSPPTGNATDVMYEQQCELTSSCSSTDQVSFKASLSRWLGKTAVLVPSVKSDIDTLLTASAVAAATDGCVLAFGNLVCGMKWWTTGFDGLTSFGSQLSALEVVQSLLVGNAPRLMKASI
ncbi:glycoside hydrolase family 76 protein [Myriangium duriaei CBS 260.36]|uniref:mannan endo-1,6-alpha-mannosidase n=1 Tax=Myriangium duriaei CBS 260.36 TaxID=1168546 RepID=A0A9P4IVC7_9PEZI|nr:glycoside hydrolase family 76 protein [Myriangium duriaei CBS 260.36]